MSYLETYRKTARESFSIHYLKPYQELIVRHILEAEESGRGSRLLACLPTGSGKSICFMLPAMLLKGKTMILYPLLSLMKDQMDRFERSRIKAVSLKGGMERSERDNTLNSFIKEDVKVMVTNPEMLIYLFESKKLESIKRVLSMIVIDEVHTAITWGESFRPSFSRLNEIFSFLRPTHIAAFTATMDLSIERGLVDLIFNGERPYTVHASADRENIFYHSLKSYSKLSDIQRILKKEEARPALIFTRSRIETERIKELLSPYFEIESYHAGMEKEKRRAIEEWFMKSCSGVLASTTAFGMGVDKPNIRTVIHTTIPETSSDFLQESGRGGRDGEKCHSYVLYHPNEKSTLDHIFKTKECIRMSLLKDMNETPESERCLACSSCSDEKDECRGRREILSILKRRLFTLEETLDKKLRNRRLYNRAYIPLWSMRCTRIAIEDLKEEKLIKINYKHNILATKSGRNWIKEHKTVPEREK